MGRRRVAPAAGPAVPGAQALPLPRLRPADPPRHLAPGRLARRPPGGPPPLAPPLLRPLARRPGRPPPALAGGGSGRPPGTARPRRPSALVGWRPSALVGGMPGR